MSSSGLPRTVRVDPVRVGPPVLAVASLVTIALGAGGRTVAVYVSDLGTLAAASAAAYACLSAAQKADGKLRWVWTLLGLSALCWAVGQLAWSWYELVGGESAPTPSVADAGMLVAVPLAVAGMLMFSPGDRSVSAAGRLRTLVDGAIIALSALTMSWVVVLSSVFHSPGGGFQHDVRLAHPLSDVLVVTVVLYVLLLRRRRRDELVVPALVGAALVAIALSSSASAYLTAEGRHAGGTLAAAGWIVGFALLAVAPGRRYAVPAGAVESRPSGTILPFVAGGAAVVTTSLAQADDVASDRFLSWLRWALIFALVLRQAFTLLENASLTNRLEQRLRELRVSKARFEALVSHSSDVVTVVDPNGIVLYQSESIQRVFGHAADGFVGEPVATMMTDAIAPRFLATLESLFATTSGVRVLAIQVLDAEGRLRDAEMTMTNLLADPAVGGIVLNTRDVSERKLLEDRLVHEASHDSLTQLANRSLFRQRVDKELRKNEGRPAKLTILFLDLDGFKEVNDSLGHATGDALLIQVAERLHSCVRPVDTVARLGGDEFAVLIADTSSERAGAAVADRIAKALSEPFKLRGREIEVGASIGIAATDQDVDDADHLLRNADLAMYRAKATGTGGFERYHPRLHVALVERLQLEAELRQALAEDELELHYQPTLSLGSGRIQGVEALARWKHPRRGYVPPGEFIPLAEQTGLIRRLGCFGLRVACRQLAEWQREFPEYEQLTMSVNISGRHLEDPSLIDDVQDALAESGIQPSQLVLEMTESVLMDHTQANVELLARLKEIGVGLAIDDFGTGYSSLAYLHRFPADVIKIDRSFVERLGGSESDTELLRTIVQLGQSLRMVTVAEGVETAEQALALQQMGCELAQGFHFHRPLTPQALQQLLAVGAPDEQAGRRAAA
jgi:diguanylate cyclase (GGDEF)-like protein/PAS domain S-box-containing protein